MGKDLIDYNAPLDAQGITDLAEKYSSPQHFMQRAVKWARQQGGLYGEEVAAKAAAPAPEKRTRKVKSESAATSQ
jgi:hypothetical protein|tara:strand:- start:577 stop:801 length:225 start_codon:yes stop_codon:yes gene_type:complete